MKYDIDVVVISCDKYSDVWPYFFENFDYYWNDCPLQIYLISNKKKYRSKKINNILTVSDVSWSDNLLFGLKHLNSKYVLLMIDDLILNKKISNISIMKIFNWVVQNEPNHVRLHVSNNPIFYNDLVGLMPLKTPYKISTMPSIWKRSFLQDILKHGESAWDFEIQGSKRAFTFGEFYSLYENCISYDNSIIKSKWQRHMIKKLNITNSSRPAMLASEQLSYNIRVLRSKLFNSLPNYLRLKLKNI